MRLATAAVLLTLTQVSGLSAQTNRSFYLGGTAGVELGSRDDIHVGGVRTAGVVLGIPIGGRWSVEFEADRGDGISDERVFEGFLFSRQPAPTDEERQRVGVFGRSSYMELAGGGYSAQVVWRTREPGRVNAAVFTGISWRRFLQHHERVITEVGPDADISPDDPELAPVDTLQRLTGGGYSAGVLIPIRLGGEFHLAPEARFTFGGISGGDGFYRVFRTGVRLLWGW